ncbi:succinate dehydrogenase/fumarate reductase transmembrane subunit [Megalodesulfovibrio paquesii]
MCTGALLIVFMWSHMLLVSSVLLGASVMNSLAGFFEATGLAQLGGPCIGLLFLLHFVLAARRIPFRQAEQRAVIEHARLLKHTDTWLWLVQVASALAVLVLGCIHMWTVLADLPITAAKSAARVQQWPWTLLYLVLLPMVELHVSIGFYRIGVKWGFISRARRPLGLKAEKLLTAVFLAIGILTLIRFLTLSAA